MSRRLHPGSSPRHMATHRLIGDVTKLPTSDSVAKAQRAGFAAARERARNGVYTIKDHDIACKECGKMAVYCWNGEGVCSKHKTSLTIRQYI